jgi:tetratricopeptide (TPR) repeat protein
LGDAATDSNSIQSPGGEGAKDQKLLQTARELLGKVDTITRLELPIQIRARKAAARAQLIQYLHEDDNNSSGAAELELEKAFVDAVKLDPDNVQCWNGAAKALWKKGDLQSAQLCYQRSLEHKPGKLAYQNLSMLQRQVAKGQKQEQSQQNINESLVNAKAAVALDVQDGHSWYLLGNAYLFQAFCVPSNERDELIDKSLKTYKHAMKLHKSETCNVDLRFNYGVVCKYLEQHLEALRAFEYCDKMDATLCANDQKDEITHTLSQLTTLVDTKCGMKAKRIAKVQENIASGEKQQSSTRHLKFVTLGELSGIASSQNNPKTSALSCSVVHTVPVRSAVPLVYVCMDSQGQFFALTIYGLEENKLQMMLSRAKHKTLQIVSPAFHKVEITWQNRTYHFPCIRVNQLSTLVVDGQPVMTTSKTPGQAINCFTTTDI